mgnify:CR=1 FL=1
MSQSRIQVLVPEALRRELEEVARETGRSLSDLGREAFERLLAEWRRRKREAALKDLFAIDVPVDEWPVLERELAEARLCDTSST